ncbi:MAG: NINE protein [Clostridia bacterium]|nr:NINE protein [Clostridia bacterium]
MENNTTTQEVKTKFCKHCGAKIAEDAVLCTHCGRQVEEIKSQAQQPSIVINNDNNNVNSNTNMNQNGMMGYGRPKNKWVALILCFFLGFLGAHKFYEGKAGMGVLYILTVGLFGIGIFVDFITLLFKPTTYFVF